MFGTVKPVAFIGLSVGIGHYAKTFPLAIFVISLISVAVSPDILPFSMHLIIFPLPTIGISILVLHISITLKLIVAKLSLEDTTLLHQHSLAMSLPIDEFSIISTLISINSLTPSIRHVVLPLALIFISSLIHIFSISICYIIF